MVTPRWPRKAINFDHPHVVFVLYPWGAGGKFLINSMAVSDAAVLPDVQLAQQQFSHQLNVQQKKELILQRLSQETGQWQDLHFSVDALTGVSERMYIMSPVDTAQYWPWFDFMSTLTQSSLTWFFDIHDAGHLSAALRVWPKARVIKFVNTDEFLVWRGVNYNRSSLQEFWTKIRDSSWPTQSPETYDEFCKLDHGVQQELLHVRAGDIFRYIQHPVAKAKYEQSYQQSVDRACSRSDTLVFDASVLNHSEKFIQSLERCYQWLEFRDFDKHFATCYHEKWLEKIQQVPI